MKIDMSREAVTHRLKQVNELRHACLVPANTSVGKKIREKFAGNKLVQRTSKALGR